MIITFESHRNSHIRGFVTGVIIRGAVLGAVVTGALMVGTLENASESYGDVIISTKQTRVISGESITADESMISATQSNLKGALTLSNSPRYGPLVASDSALHGALK